jgi:mannose-1-phosphate guanylyltransferase/mannose-6-phosphate isomerase
MMDTIVPVILCGGSGTRLWPLSRKSYPKQFARLLGDKTLFQASVSRMSGEGFGKPVILTGSDFRFIVTEQLAEIKQPHDAILIEPNGRNTAPAILAAALYLRETNPKTLMLVGPSDHVIADEDAFRSAIQMGVSAAKVGSLISFGIKPTRAETGYGYLELSHADTDGTAQDLLRFVEKPNEIDAQAMLDSGKFLWNAGIFLFTAEALIKAFEEHMPSMIGPCEDAVRNAKPDLDFLRLDEDAWMQIEDISIDYAIMERAKNLSVVPFDGGWNDLGSWQAVWQEEAETETSVVTSGNARAIECSNTLLRSETKNQEIVGIGLDNIVAIAMPDAVLIADKSRTQDVGKAVALLKVEGAKQATEFPRDHRPWGWFETLSLGPRFQVKQIMVHPGAALSLQSHVHRAEHWVVVQGAAMVTIDDSKKLVSENESVFIPLGTVHRLENPGKVDLHLIEVQTGSYLGEDDIVRYEDVYARK